jgi:membrane fusion protein, type I secretion system
MPTPPEEDSLELDRPLPVVRAPLAIRSPGLLGMVAVIAAVVGFGFWAASVPLDSGVVAQGKVTVAGKRREVQHLDGGIVHRFAVKDGDRVNEGDVLVEFDTLRPATRLAVTRIGYFTALAAEARLIAERDNLATFRTTPELDTEASRDREIQALVESQRLLFESRRNEIQGQTQILETRIDRFEEQIKGFESERMAAEQQLGMAKEEQKTIQTLYEQHYTTRTRVLNIKREVFELKGNIGRLTAQIAGANKEIGETELNLEQIKKKNATEVLSELRETQSKVLDLREQLAASKGELERTLLRAPASGIVFGSKIHTIGGVVRGGETLLEIVPDHDQLVVEVRLRPQDVDDVQVTQPTEVRLTAFNQRTTPTLQGRVAFISADTLIEQRSPEPYYLASIEVNAEELRHLGSQRLQPGMPAEALIKTGQRTAMAYLLRPLSDSFNRAWREH